MTEALTGLQLHSTISRADTGDGTLRLTLDPVTLPAPTGDEIVVRVEAAPVNPSDLALLVGPADLATLARDGGATLARDGGATLARDGGATLARDGGATVATVPERRLAAVTGRLGQPLPVGNEGAGTVVAAGPEAQALVGRTVAAIGGGMYAQLRTVRARDVLVLPEGTPAAAGAAAFVNPLTALSMVETMRRDGHQALVHTAAASNLGQMLVRLCAAEGVPLVNIVRSEGQAALLRDLGAEHVVDSSADGLADALTAALAATGATLAFDAIGGGPLAGQILAAMERVAARSMGAYNRYGSDAHKQVYIYGALDLGPTVLDRSYGFAWGVSGWLLTPFMARIGGERVAALRARVAAELTTTFASRYTATIGLAEAIAPDTIRAYARRATGEKYLIDPSR